jgi:hypothetical protein
MKATVKAARPQIDQGKSPFSAMACLLLLLFAGILVKFAVFTPFFHVAH